MKKEPPIKENIDVDMHESVNISDDEPTSDVNDYIQKKDVDEYIEKKVNELYAEKKAQVKFEEKQQETRDTAAQKAHRDSMLESPEPWVTITGYKETPQGLRIMLDWNYPFIEYLKRENIAGADEDEIVHKWLAMLMQDVTKDSDV